MDCIHHHTDGLRRLDDDVLLHIFEILRPKHNLRDLSRTCRWIRALCSPILFRRCYRILNMPIVLHNPETLIPVQHHVRSMEIRDICSDQFEEPDSDDEPPNPLALQWTREPLFCGVLSAPHLTAFLETLPNLRSVTLFTLTINPHGLSWETLKIILALPVLRELTIQRLRFNAKYREGDDLTTVSPSPLTMFRHQVLIPSKLPAPSVTETNSLACVLKKTHLTLETLHLFAISAPIRTLVELPWPRLHELAFQGSPWGFFPPYPVELFKHMSRLRSLKFKFALPVGQGANTQRQPIWPPGYQGPFPWPELEKLVVSCPNVEDELYEHLPSTLRFLSLRYWKHANWYRHWERDHAQRPDYTSLLRPSELLRILHRCHIPALENMELEYLEDDAEEELFALIKTSFPRLTSLTLFRFRRDRDNDTMPNMDGLAKALSTLKTLQHLRLHPDLPHAVIPSIYFPNYPGIPGSPETYAKFEEQTIQPLVDNFARVMGASLTSIAITSVSRRGHCWSRYSVEDGSVGQKLD